MTCVVGYERDGAVVIAADSAGTAGHVQRERADEKAFVLEDFALGFCGSYRVGQLLRHALTVPPYDPRTDRHRYLSGPFVDAVRSVLRGHGALRTKDGVEELDGPFLVGWRGELYHVEADFQVARFAQPYAVTGSGWQLALGALHVLSAESGTKKPEQVAKRALEAAAAFDAYVAPPFITVRAPTVT